MPEDRLFLTNETYEGRVLDPADVGVLRSASSGSGVTALNEQALMQLARDAWETLTEFRGMAASMTPGQASYVADLRLVRGYSWRALARACHDEGWPNLRGWSPPSNQIMGMALCERAAELLPPALAMGLRQGLPAL